MVKNSSDHFLKAHCLSGYCMEHLLKHTDLTAAFIPSCAQGNEAWST